MDVDDDMFEMETAAYMEFINMWYGGEFKGQRFGQAFYNHFHLHKLSDQDKLGRLYEANQNEAIAIIISVFRFN